jgi:membrane fusion protein (multidrug efflux system)
VNRFAESRLSAAFFVLALLGACAQEAPPPPVVEVLVDEVVRDPYQPKSSFVGRLQAIEDVSIEAQVSGYLKSRNFREGEVVEAGTLLYEIDPAAFEAAVSRAEADLARKRATQKAAENNFKRGQELLPDGNISASEMDRLTAEKLEADAAVASAKAQVKTAEVNLSYTKIRAPIEGRIGRSVHSTGDLVGPNTGVLTTLVSVDPIHAIFQLSEATFVQIIVQRMGQGEVRSLNDAEFGNLVVRLELRNRSFYPEIGRIDYLSNRISEDTGTLEARAIIPNPGGLLVPGQYVRVVIVREELSEALFVPQAAVQADQEGSFVLVVEGGVVKRRNVVLDERVDDKIVVLQGVEEGEKVIVRGLQQVRPGQPVTTQHMPAFEA